MSASEASNYEYVTARVKARRAALYDEEDYRQIVRMGPGEIARFMEESAYDREINRLGARHDGVDLIEYALNANLARHFEDLLRWAGGDLYEGIARYLRKFDAWNVKTVLRGMYADADRQEIEDDLIQAGELSEGRLDDLLTAESIEGVIELLGDTMFGDPLEAAYGDYEDSGLLVPLENAVDRAYFENLLSGVRDAQEGPTELYVEFLEAEIDFRNVRNALRIAHSGADIAPSEYFIEGGRLFDEDEIGQLARNTDDLVAELRESVYADDLSDALDRLDDAGGLVEFERALEAALLEYTNYLSHVYPLSICPVLAFVLAKEREVDNIRAIARGKEAGLEPEEIMEELVII